MKYLLIVSMAFIGLLMGNSKVIAQTKSCDVEMQIASPQDGEVFQIGDTASLRFKFINHGPDDLFTSDTIFFFWSFNTGAPMHLNYFVLTANIPAGDSLITGHYVAYIADGIDSSNDTTTACAYLADTVVNYIDSNRNNDTAGCVTFILKGSGPSGIATPQNRSNSFSLYPNPAAGQVVLSLNLDKPQPVTVSIMDLPGRRVWQHHYGQLKGKEKQSIDLSHLESGLYFIQVSEGNKRRTEKLIIR